MLCEDRIAAGLRTARFGRALTVVAETASTNTDLRRLAEAGAPEGTTLVAARQTGGRGRRGRSFHSPEGGLYLSTLLRPAAGTDMGLLTSCAAVAAARAIESLCPLSVGIKWVNDLYLHGRKVCGILAEAGFTAVGTLDYAVLGFGINVALAALPPELASIATTLGNEGAAVEREALAAALLNEWERAYATLPTGDFLAESRRRSVVLGRSVQVTRGDESFSAMAEAITDAGHLMVRTADGLTELLSGEVSLRL